jgi:hypothetical protein
MMIDATEYVIEAKGDVFIIPNHGGTLESMFITKSEERNKNIELMCQVNNIVFNEFETELVHVWITSKDLNTNNLCDHGFIRTIAGKECRLGLDFDIFPAELFSDKHEGDIIEVYLPCTGYMKDDIDTEISVPVKMQLRLAQTEHRYSNFGKFEDVLTNVLN